MSDRFFLDTNVFVYSFSDGEKAGIASTLIRKGMATQQGIVSYQVVQEFFHVALRRFAKPMAVSEAQQYLASVFRPMLAVQSSSGIYWEALRLAGRYQLAWYDSLIVAGALSGECSVLYSEDFQDGMVIDGLKIVNPFHVSGTVLNPLSA